MRNAPSAALSAQQSPIQAALVDFDSLPDTAHVSVDVVARIYGAGVSTIWARVKSAKIPAPKKFGGSTRWNVGELRRSIADQSGGGAQ